MARALSVVRSDLMRLPVVVSALPVVSAALGPLLASETA